MTELTDPISGKTFGELRAEIARLQRAVTYVDSPLTLAVKLNAECERLMRSNAMLTEIIRDHETELRELRDFQAKALSTLNPLP